MTASTTLPATDELLAGALPGLDVFHACENEDHLARFTCECGRQFKIKTAARVGVTRANANRHAAACEDALLAATRAAEQENGEEEVVVQADLSDAVAVATARREADKPLELTPSGKVAKMVRVSLDVRVSTDGNWIVARHGDVWRLFAAAPGVAHYRSEWPTCTAAFAPANLGGEGA